MKASILFLVLVCTVVCAGHWNDDPAGEYEDVSEDNLGDFLEAFKEGDKERMAKLTMTIVSFSKTFQRKTKLMAAVKSTVLKMLKRFTDLERFGAMRAVILNLLTKLANKDTQTPADLQTMIDWVEKRKIEGASAEGNLDAAAEKLKVAKEAFLAIQEKAERAVEGVKDATARGQPFDQEKTRVLIKEVVDAFEANGDKFLPNIEAAVKGFDLAYSELRLKNE